MTRLLVEVEDFADTARDVRAEVAMPLAQAATTLSARLYDAAGVAGDDPTGRGWAGAYDRAARAAVTALAACVESCLRLASLFGQSARNYAAADADSTAGDRAAIDALVAALPVDGSFGAAVLPPTAVGPGDGPPSGWGLVHDVVTWVWPNGHQDRLHRAHAAWSDAAAALDQAAGLLGCDPILFTGHGLPEAADVQTVCDAMAHHLRDLAHGCRVLGDACSEYAGDLDWAHAQVLGDLGELAAWITATEATSALASIFSFGIAEGVGQGAVLEEIAWKGADIAQALGEFATRIGALALRLPPVRDLAEDITALTERLRTAQLVRPALAGVPNLPRIGAVFRVGGGEFGATERLATGASGASSATRVDLGAQERIGGHTIARHVGKTDRELRARGVDLASTFTTLEDAEIVTGQNLAANAPRIRAWMAKPGGRLEVTSPVSGNVGRVYVRATDSFVTPKRVVTVVERTPGGIRVLTSYLAP